MTPSLTIRVIALHDEPQDGKSRPGLVRFVVLNKATRQVVWMGTVEAVVRNGEGAPFRFRVAMPDPDPSQAQEFVVHALPATEAAKASLVFIASCRREPASTEASPAPSSHPALPATA